MPKPSSADAIYRVTYEPEAREQLNQLYDYIATEASPGIAKGFTDAIVERCERLARFPSRGTPRDDLRAGIRTIAVRRSVTIAYRCIRAVSRSSACFHAAGIMKRC